MIDFLLFQFPRSADAKEKNKLIRERRLAKKLAREHYSLRMTALYKLSVANHFRDHVFWLPINLDFRGRVYPIPPHCAHVGKDWVWAEIISSDLTWVLFPLGNEFYILCWNIIHHLKHECRRRWHSSGFLDGLKSCYFSHPFFNVVLILSSLLLSCGSILDYLVI